MNNLQQDKDGNWVPAIPIGMVCEKIFCRKEKGAEYFRLDNEKAKGWETEPIYLCEKHSIGHMPYYQQVTENKTN